MKILEENRVDHIINVLKPALAMLSAAADKRIRKAVAKTVSLTFIVTSPWLVVDENLSREGILTRTLIRGTTVYPMTKSREAASETLDVSNCLPRRLGTGAV